VASERPGIKAAEQKGAFLPHRKRQHDGASAFGANAKNSDEDSDPNG
jgi:hypothetical protein